MNINHYYTKEQIDTFLTILESIIRSEDIGTCELNGKQLTVAIKVD